MPKKLEIAIYWSEQKVNFYGLDHNEPACFACGYWTKHWGEGKSAWDHASLERAHILARSAGGDNDVSNIVLLCRECHDAAPMTRDRDAFIRWILQRESFLIKRFHAVIKECEAIGLTLGRLAEHASVRQGTADFLREAKAIDAGIHAFSTSTLSPATMALILDRLIHGPTIFQMEDTVARVQKAYEAATSSPGKSA